MADTLSPVSKLSISFQSFSPFLEDSSKHTTTTSQTASDDFVFKKPTARPTKRIIHKDAQPTTGDKENCEPNAPSASSKGVVTKRRNSVKRKASERSPWNKSLAQSAIGLSTRIIAEATQSTDANAPAIAVSTEEEGAGSPYKAPPVVKQRRATVSSPPRPSLSCGDLPQEESSKKNPLKMTSDNLHTASTQHPVRQRRMTHSEGDLPKFHICRLPLLNLSSDLNCISPDTVASLIKRQKYHNFYDEVHVIDCRFGYEFEGGHIMGAKNLVTIQDVERLFVASISPLKERICLIFHCEFSSHRGPTLCRFLRSWDRTMHEHCYPQLYYPELYVLEGGYKAFYESHPELCEPQAYIPMLDGRFTEQMRSGLLCAKENKRGMSGSTAGGAGGGCGPNRSRSWSISAMAPHPLDPTSLMTQSQPDLTIFTRRQRDNGEEPTGEEEEEEEETRTHVTNIKPTKKTLSRESRKKLQEDVLSSSPKRSLSSSRDSCRTRVPPICFDKLKSASSANLLNFSEPVRVRRLQLDETSTTSSGKLRRGGSAIDFSSAACVSTSLRLREREGNILRDSTLNQTKSCRVRRRDISLLEDFEAPSSSSSSSSSSFSLAASSASEDLDSFDSEEDTFLNL